MNSKLESEPLVSVVTPVYNGERFLRHCIESVLAQTYSNWDYTIVNNCSTDRSLEIAQEYAARDPRIKVVTNQTFVRVIPNYNNAFRQTSPHSKYCKPVAADDQLFPHCLVTMVRHAEEHPSVGVVGAYSLQEAQVMWQGLPYPSPVVPGREMARAFLLGPYAEVFGSPTACLFRSEIVRSRHAFFNESNIHADAEACLKIMEHHDYGFVHQILTCQGARKDSLSNVSIRLQTYLPGTLSDLKECGPKFLTEEELKGRIDEHLHRYYWYLGEQVYKRRDKEFWDFHRKKLDALGYPLSRMRVARYAALFGLDVLLNPKKSVGEAVRRWRRKASPSTP